jgi:hypothetical protein
LARLVGQENDFTMSILIPEEVDGANILKVTEEDLNITQK